MFQKIQHIDDIRSAVADVKEIRFSESPNGATIGCYMFADSHTFDTPESLECRGIAFGADGTVVSRPLHKFFNLGEKAWLSPELLRDRKDIAAIFEKLDGSMLVTAWVGGKLQWRSKKSFSSDVVKLTEQMLALPENGNLAEFAVEVARNGMTAIFELTHPQARIVVAPDKPRLRLLHVRDNLTGEYLMLDKGNPIHGLISAHAIPVAPQFAMTSIDELLALLPEMKNQEGYVIQFADGDMVKVKCPWYLRLHRSITFVRERDIAELALAEELDDAKSALVEAGLDLAPVLEVESRLKAALLDIFEKVESGWNQYKHLDRKGYAIALRADPLFGMMMAKYLGQEVDIVSWYRKFKLKEDFGLTVLNSFPSPESLDA